MSKEYFDVYKITDIKDEARGVRTLLLDKNMDVKPGNFVMIWLPGISENPFSISYTNPLGITIKKAGDMSNELYESRIGDKLWIRGPYGNSFLDFVGDSRRIMIAGGTGAIPLALLSDCIKNESVLLGAKTKDDLIFEDRFRNNSKNVYVSTDDGSYGYHGLITDIFEEVLIEKDAQFYICGPEAMMRKVAEMATKYANPENVVLSMERYMKCGRGLCGSCEVNGYRVCKDGPVFSYDMIRDAGYTRLKSGLMT